MSLIQDVSPEELARLFYHYEEALAGDFHCESKKHHGTSWEQASNNERRLRVAAARLALLELSTTSPAGKINRDYFPKPGEAEWGC